MNWAKAAAEAIIDDDADLQAEESRRHRRNMLLTLGGLAAAGGLGYAAYKNRGAIGDKINHMFPSEGYSVGGVAGGAGRAGLGALAAAWPAKQIRDRLPFGHDLGTLKADIGVAQAGEKNMTPGQRALAAQHNASPEDKAMLAQTTKLLDNPELTKKLLAAHSSATGHASNAVPGPGATWGERLKHNVGSFWSGAGRTQSQRDAKQLGDALTWLGESANRGEHGVPELHNEVLAQLGQEPLKSGSKPTIPLVKKPVNDLPWHALPSNDASLGRLRSLGRAVDAHGKSHGRFTPGATILRTLGGLAAPDIIGTTANYLQAATN